MAACDGCLRRTWLLDRLSGYLEFRRSRVELMLSLEDQELIDCWLEIAERRGLGYDLRGEFAAFGHEQAEAARERAQGAGLEQICVCQDAYPKRLRRLASPPAVIHVAGGLARFLELADADPVAVVGTRRPTVYGTEVARSLGRGASVSGLSLVSGMAAGVDAAAHRGALAGGGKTVAVLPGCASTPYPRANQQLHAQILRNGVAVGELGVGACVRKWNLVARNRIIAGLAELTVVVQGRRRSGALRTAEFAEMLGGRVAAVPGSVLAPQSEGPHDLLRNGAVLIRDPQDMLDAICGVGERKLADAQFAALGADEREVLDAIRSGADTVAALSHAEVGGGALLMLIAELELAGCVRRGAGGRYIVAG